MKTVVKDHFAGAGSCRKWTTLSAAIVESSDIFKMADPLRFVGRVGKLKDESLPSPYVQVEAYDAETAEYQVNVPKDRGDTRRVKRSDIEFQTTPPEFMDAFSNPPRFMIRGILDMKNIPSRSIVDFTECTKDPIIDGRKIIIRGSYRFIGKRSVSEDGTVVLTRLPFCVFVGAQTESDIIEFENIWFDVHTASSHNVVCLRGNIVFRNCVINGAAIGLKVGSGITPVNVLFEGGAIYYKGGSGVTVHANTQLTMVGVEVAGHAGIRSGVGAHVKSGGFLTAHYCSFKNNYIGAAMNGEGSKSEFTTCSFQSNRRCSVLVDSGALSMAHCKTAETEGCDIIIDRDRIGKCCRFDGYLHYCKLCMWH